MRVRWIVPALAAALLAFTTPAHALEPWTAEDTHQALEGSPAVIDCVVRLESTYQPYAIGARGELGVAQLLPTENGGGQMAEYLYGDWVTVQPAYRSPFDPYLSVAYLEYWGATHDGTYYPWTTWRYCQ